MKRKKGYMDFSLYKRIVDEASKEGPCQLRLFLFGESFLHKELPEMIRYAKEKNIPFVDINTNATLLTPEKSRAIIESGLDQITFSLDGAKKETYESIRQGAKFEEVNRNIEQFLVIRKELGRDKPKAVLQTMIMDDTKEEVRKVYERWKGKVDGVSIQEVHTQAGQAADRRFIKYSVKDPSERKPCWLLWSCLVIYVDGRVGVCCVDVEGMLQVGDLNSQTLKEIWIGQRLRMLRLLHEQKNFHLLPLCRDCATYEKKLVREREIVANGGEPEVQFVNKVNS
jgi:MoaA/NifB/PqqE/SkfB family radical SAM enzyme